MAQERIIRVLVVDDSAFMRKAISNMLSTAGDIEVVDTARDGIDAIEKVQKLDPDVVTLDIEMPHMDGLTALRQIKRVRRAAVLMVSSLTTEGSIAALQALRSGAADVIAKDVSQVSLDVIKIEKELICRVRAVAERVRRGGATPMVAPVSHVSRSANLRATSFDLVIIGSSTGGPPVLETIFSAMPAHFPLPIIIAQHMPLLFTKSMSERLNELSGMTVVHGEMGMGLMPGHAYVTPGGRHARVRKLFGRPLELIVSDRPREALYKPSVDVLLQSAAEQVAPRVLAIILTGMGEDGLIGARPLHAKGGTIIAQDHDSCVVYGMPRAVTQAGLAQASLPPQSIAEALAAMARRRQSA